MVNHFLINTTMKNLILVALISTTVLLAGCQSKEMDVLPVANPGTVIKTEPVDVSGQKLLSQGTFMSNVHPTSGTVKLYEKDGKRTLIFTDFKTDGGPDLRIYLAETTGVRNFIELTKLNAGGNFSVELPAEADPARQRYVLIWCKAFSVLFGNAELK